MLLKQKIRQAALSRSNSGAMSREISHLQEEETGEVIDLTDKKQPPKTVITNSVITSTSQNLPIMNNSGLGSSNSINNKNDERLLLLRDQEYLQHQREILIRNSMNVSRKKM
jgi:histone deacetylase 4/5